MGLHHHRGGTSEVDPFVSVVLTEGNRIKVAGRLAERAHVRAIRKHEVATAGLLG